MRNDRSPLLAADVQREALDFVVTKLARVLLATLRGMPPELEAAIITARSAIEKPLTATEFFFVLSEMLVVLNDAHTAVEVPEEALPRYQFIRLPFQWLDEGIVVTAATAELCIGDRVQSLGGMSEDDLLVALRRVISAENDYFIKGLAPQKLTRCDFLGHLGLLRDDDTVEIALQRNGKSFTVHLALADRETQEPDRHWVGYAIDVDHSLGVFHLDRCDFNDAYTGTLKQFMTDVAHYGLRTVAVDLRRNKGGNGLVADAFLAYLDADYDSFAMRQRNSEEFLEQEPIFASEWVRQLAQSFDVDLDGDSFFLPKEAVKAGAMAQLPGGAVEERLKFDRDVYILTSGVTFSSANLFATLVQDNKLGVILGEPTGNEVNLHGNMVTFDIPGTGFLLTLSSDRKQRPDRGRPDEPTVMPDIRVPTTRQDIISGRDAQLEWLKKAARERGPSSRSG